ncbi:Sensor protein CreC [Roseibium album]|nr:Sensor protein CreC [Roseibium album]
MLLSRSFRDKWRPSLSLVVALVLAIMLLVPLAGIAFFRVYENQLVQATEAELIAQSAAIAALTAQRLSETNNEVLPLGRTVREQAPASDYRQSFGNWSPLLPTLDLNKTTVLTARPDAMPPDKPAHPAYAQVGEQIEQVLRETQKRTLAGFRLLDFNGVVVAGRDEVGKSLAHVKEVKRALGGRYASVLRERVVDNPQPIYSISRGTAVRVFTAVPIELDGRIAGVVYASRTPSNILKEMFLKREAVLWVLAFILGATFIVGYIFVRAISGPIRALTARSLKIGDGDRGAMEPLAIHGNREIHALSESMLDMSRKLFERNDYINTFANHVSHELKSPLTAIQGAAELLQDDAGDLSDEDRARFLNNILKDTERASLLLTRLRTLARADSVEIRGACQLAEVLQTARGRFEGVSISWSEDCTLPMSEENARIVFENMIDNAAKHGADKVHFSVGQSGATLRIEVGDNGSGVSEGNASQIFDLFFTTRRESGGTGMGLGIVQALLKAHNAAIRFVPGSDKGAVFEVRFDPPQGT